LDSVVNKSICSEQPQLRVFDEFNISSDARAKFVQAATILSEERLRDAFATDGDTTIRLPVATPTDKDLQNFLHENAGAGKARRTCPKGT